MPGDALGTRLPSDLDALAMLSDGTSYADAVHRLLAVVRTQLGMQVAWVSEFVGSDQVLRFVDAAEGADAPAEGPLGGPFCARVLDGRFPALSERDLASLRLLVQLLHDLQARALSAADTAREQERMQRALTAVVAGEGRHPVLQPVVDLVTGRAVLAEGLTRFTATSPAAQAGQPSRSPAQWFDDAGRLGLRTELELSTAGAVLDLLDDVPNHVALSVNLAPRTMLGGGLMRLLDGRPLERIVVEMTEHAPVDDYDLLAATLQPYRDGGLKVAVDDAGAGYASLRHVLAVRPDLIKIDMVLIRGCGDDLARRTLLNALADFADATSCRLVAEGVETDSELRAVAACGVHLAQGYLLARPSRLPQWTGFAVP